MALSAEDFVDTEERYLKEFDQIAPDSDLYTWAKDEGYISPNGKLLVEMDDLFENFLADRPDLEYLLEQGYAWGQDIPGSEDDDGFYYEVKEIPGLYTTVNPNIMEDPNTAEA